jgi:adenine/guanine phosphoribosyltransferase-like PRPP-binding protein
MRIGGELGGEIVQLNFLMELGFLNGREKIKDMMFFGNDVLTPLWSHNSGSQ